MKRTLHQNRQLFAIFGNLGISPDIRADLAYHFSRGRTTSTSELTKEECDQLIESLNKETKRTNETLSRLRWKLIFSFKDSGYKGFCTAEGKVDYTAINKYCQEHWGKSLAEMNSEEFNKYIDRKSVV